MTVLDTHALVWWISQPEKLSAKARQVIEKEQRSGQLLVSSISVWEIYMLVKKDRLKFTMDIEEWFEQIENLPFIQFVPVDNQIAAGSVNLPGELHQDPADRMIVATAREKGAVLITSDEKIRSYDSVRTLW